MSSLRELFETSKPKQRIKYGKFSFVAYDSSFKIPEDKLEEIFRDVQLTEYLAGSINYSINKNKTNKKLNASIHLDQENSNLYERKDDYDDFYEDYDDLYKSINQSKSSVVEINHRPKNKVVNKFLNCDSDYFSDERTLINDETIKKMYDILKNTFGHTNFRHKQKQTIIAALMGYDVFVLMPTGAGKSLCYQLPAVFENGITIVISPLVALIEDQLVKMSSFGIPAISLTGAVSVNKCDQIYKDILNKKKIIKLLYVTPEKINGSDKFKAFLNNLYSERMISRFVIDEAHCISQWGHDFRPDYSKLYCLRTMFMEPKIPMMVLTATATPAIVEDIKKTLSIEESKMFMSSFSRPNLKYEVIPKTAKSQEMLLLKIQKTYPNKSGIIYCFSKKDCDVISESLQKYSISSICYHAGLSAKKRTEAQRLWMSNSVQVICATIAFGMGIDKPDVRFVIHLSLPKSIESYYQESGRAGRDGLPSYCAILYNYTDSIKQKCFIDETNIVGKSYRPKKNIISKKLQHENVCKMIAYCEAIVDCRRKLLVEHFGELYDTRICKANMETICDNCENSLRPKNFYTLYDMTNEAELVMKATIDIPLTVKQIVDCYRGYGSKNQSRLDDIQSLEIFGRGSSLSDGDVNRFVIKLITDGYLKEEIKVINGNGFSNITGYLMLTSKGHKFLSSIEKPTFKLLISDGKGKNQFSKQINLSDLGIL
uniref:ATP-dependent DNA helicase n=1 Tax=Parastrongyloides trichosuri TaxID=131310 RepID=A0A0N4ZRB0_PARTI